MAKSKSQKMREKEAKTLGYDKHEALRVKLPRNSSTKKKVEELRSSEKKHKKRFFDHYAS